MRVLRARTINSPDRRIRCGRLSICPHFSSRIVHGESKLIGTEPGFYLLDYNAEERPLSMSVKTPLSVFPLRPRFRGTNKAYEKS